MLVVEVILVVIMNQVKDVRVPAQLMRAMAAEAEAAREARAKVVLFMTIHTWGPRKTIITLLTPWFCNIAGYEKI